MSQDRSKAKRRAEKVRLSRSKSSFTERSCVIVFKNPDGSYSRPIELSHAQAIDIAERFAQTQTIDTEYNLDESAAKFILSKSRELGFVAKELTNSNVNSQEREDTIASGLTTDTSVASQVTSHERPDLRPRFLPLIDPFVAPAISSETIDTLAFVLSGVDPSQRSNRIALNANLQLRDLAKMSSARISAGALLRDDHWYVLAHLHSLDVSEFKVLWENAQSQTSGQSNTDLVKKFNRLEKFEIDLRAKNLEDSKNQAFFVSLREHSVDLLSRMFRRSRKKIELDHEQSAETPSLGWRKLLRFLRRKPAVQFEFVQVSQEVQNIVRDYLTQTIKLGRIIRYGLLKNTPAPADR